jgi:nitrile hydratase accessory protein
LEPERLQALPRLPRDSGELVFAEPWQAQAFALAVKLSEQGHFTWKEWAAALANELKVAASRGEPDDGSHYYDHWLAALEHLVTAKGLADRASLLVRKEAWAEAYRRTPHGKPVELVATSGKRGLNYPPAHLDMATGPAIPDYLGSVLRGLATRQINRVGELANGLSTSSAV